MADYSRDELIGTLTTVVKKGRGHTEDSLLSAAARYVGFVRVTQGMKKTHQSAIRAAIDQGRIRREEGQVHRA